MKWNDLATPCALVDLDRLKRNCAAFSRKASRLDVTLRPHVKTHKCVEAARLQSDGGEGTLTVSTLQEAKAFAKAGFDDLTWAVPLPVHRLREVEEVARSTARFALLVDHDNTVTELEDFAKARRLSFPVFLKVDCGYHRAGVDPGSPKASALALRIARSSSLEFRGILTHAGHAYGCRSRDEVLSVARRERDMMVTFAEELGALGVEVHEVSVGSTPTFSAVDRLDGITEVRPGNYAFFDATQVALGSCSLEEVAFTVLATVIGHYPERGALVLDAGALALSKDAGPSAEKENGGYGIILTQEGKSIRGLKLAALSQEHGHVVGLSPGAVEDTPLGSRVRIVPNHSCLAAACFNRYHVVSGGAKVAEWEPVRGW